MYLGRTALGSKKDQGLAALDAFSYSGLPAPGTDMYLGLTALGTKKDQGLTALGTFSYLGLKRLSSLVLRY